MIFFFSCLPHSWEACGILVSPPGAKPEPLAVKAQSPNHWTTREFPLLMDFLIKLLFNRLVLLGYRELFCLPGGLSPLDEWQVYLPIIKNPLAWSHEFQHHIYQWKKRNLCLIFYSLNCTFFKSLWKYFNFFHPHRQRNSFLLMETIRISREHFLKVFLRTDMYLFQT